MTKYKQSNDYSHFHFISSHDRLYRDCLKNVDWDARATIEAETSAYTKVLHGLAFVACLILITYAILLIQN